MSFVCNRDDIQRITSVQQQNTRLTGAPLQYPSITTQIYLCLDSLMYHIPCTLCRWACMWYQLTADGKKRVGLLAFCCRHTFQSTEPSFADVDPTLHLRLPKHGTKQCDSYDIALLLGGIHLLGTPKGGRLHFVDKRLMGSQCYSSVVPFQDTQESQL